MLDLIKIIMIGPSTYNKLVVFNLLQNLNKFLTIFIINLIYLGFTFN